MTSQYVLVGAPYPSTGLYADPNRFSSPSAKALKSWGPAFLFIPLGKYFT
jgi:hypothetical protein